MPYRPLFIDREEQIRREGARRPCEGFFSYMARVILIFKKDNGELNVRLKSLKIDEGWE